jgi:hypothetical protein
MLAASLSSKPELVRNRSALCGGEPFVGREVLAVGVAGAVAGRTIFMAEMRPHHLALPSDRLRLRSASRVLVRFLGGVGLAPRTFDSDAVSTGFLSRICPTGRAGPYARGYAAEGGTDPWGCAPSRVGGFWPHGVRGINHERGGGCSGDH